SQEGWLRQHAFWHSVYYSITEHPEYRSGGYFELHDRKAMDEVPIAAAFLYLKSHPEEDTPDIYLAGKTLKPAAMESLVRAALFDLAWQHPRFVFETFFIWKPWIIREALKSLWLGEWDGLRPTSILILVAMILMIGMLAAADVGRSRFGDLARLGVLFSFMLVPCLAIPWITVAAENVMSEQLMAVQLAALLWLSFAVA